MAVINLYDATVPIFTKFLTNVERWLDKASAFADERKFDREVFAELRLAPDQYPLRRQIQAACDQAKYTVAKLCGKEPPSHPDTEKTFDELRARIRLVLDYLTSFTHDDFVGCEDRRCAHTWMGDKGLRGGDYLDHFALPNFHFHIVTAYSILRHAGVPLGKSDFIGSLPLT
ncbi:MAG TPA: DUF1993 domain-containing protein [Kofleriaceae bacterium]|nr:DUF1993 domain-containing protein [Kofleriaceae bacterium]